jgi:endonuclease/exonuclease/phosphatase family metal-dependent hydrolase
MCVVLALVAPVEAELALKVCSFNVQFLGNSKKRDDRALASILREHDIVVIQELVAPPFPGRFPSGEFYKPSATAAEFFNEMKSLGFVYAISEEDTGTGDVIHLNSSATEWWVAFFKTNKVKLAPDLPTGFLAADRSNHPDYERVPFAFGFRSVDNNADFVLISVHLMPGATAVAKQRRHHELQAIDKWIQVNGRNEKDFIVLGDMNIESTSELAQSTPRGFVSLNRKCVPTNTNVNGPKPYDHVMFSPVYTTEIDQQFGFRVINLVHAMRPHWQRANSGRRYPGDRPYNHNEFRAYYSDHHPVEFVLRTDRTGDDD